MKSIFTLLIIMMWGLIVALKLFTDATSLTMLCMSIILITLIVFRINMDLNKKDKS